MNVRNMLLMFHSLVCSWTVQLALGTAGVYLCDNIGLVLACLPRGSTGQYMTQPSGIPILFHVLFMHVNDPYIPLFKFEEFLIYLFYSLFGIIYLLS